MEEVDGEVAGMVGEVPEMSEIAEMSSDDAETFGDVTGKLEKKDRTFWDFADTVADFPATLGAVAGMGGVAAAFLSAFLNIS